MSRLGQVNFRIVHYTPPRCSHLELTVERNADSLPSVTEYCWRRMVVVCGYELLRSPAPHHIFDTDWRVPFRSGRWSSAVRPATRPVVRARTNNSRALRDSAALPRSPAENAIAYPAHVTPSVGSNCFASYRRRYHLDPAGTCCLWLPMPPESDCKALAQFQVVQRRWQSILPTPPATRCMSGPPTGEFGNPPTPEQLVPIQLA